MKYIKLQDLEVYQLASKLSEMAWRIYEKLNWQDKKIMGDQFIESADSVGANICEGYGRYHYLDKIKFYYNSRGSLWESNDHWLELLYKRRKIDENDYKQSKELREDLGIRLNHLISSTFKAKTTK